MSRQVLRISAPPAPPAGARRPRSVTLFLWCHSMLFSAKAMPLPLTVWQMIAVGLPGCGGQRGQHVVAARRRRGRRLRARRSRRPATCRRAAPGPGPRRAAVGLVLVVIDQHREVLEPVLAGRQRRLPHRSFVGLAVADDDEHARCADSFVARVQREAEADGHAVAEAAGRGLDAGDVVLRMAAEHSVALAELRAAPPPGRSPCPRAWRRARGSRGPC